MPHPDSHHARSRDAPGETAASGRSGTFRG
jgi:hypothetical protein